MTATTESVDEEVTNSMWGTQGEFTEQLPELRYRRSVAVPRQNKGRASANIPSLKEGRTFWELYIIHQAGTQDLCTGWAKPRQKILWKLLCTLLENLDFILWAQEPPKGREQVRMDSRKDHWQKWEQIGTKRDWHARVMVIYLDIWERNCPSYYNVCLA